MGPAAGGAVYSPALTDFVIMVDKTSQMFVTGPDVIKTVTGEDVGMEELGGALTHNTRSRASRTTSPSDEDDALDYARTLHRRSCPTTTSPTPPVYDARAPSSRSPTPTAGSTRSSRTARTSRTTCTTVIEHIVDDGDFLEMQPLFAPNIVVGFGRDRGPLRRHHRQPAAARWPAR